MFVTVAYLQTEKNGWLYYRRKFPKKLQRFIPSESPTGKGRSELHEALEARDINEPGAKQRLQKWRVRCVVIIAGRTLDPANLI